MRVKINRDVCGAHLAFCERCLGRFLLHPEGYERQCFEELEDDGNQDLTIELHSGGQDTVVTLSEEERKLVAYEGWAYFVDIDIPMYRDVAPREQPK
ncbi:MAG: hypothetical protein HC915_16065 [Anaerolineae bacterium]|nr:hypothetical protein [Anaerolineae bacterium]